MSLSVFILAAALLAISSTGSAKEITGCLVSNYGDWSKCSAANCPQGHNPFSFHLDTPAMEDKGRQMMKYMMEEKQRVRKEKGDCKASNSCPELNNVPTTGPLECVDGMAGDLYPCRNADQLFHIDIHDLGYKDPLPGDFNPEGNDIWGWTDPETGDEYAIVCVTGGTSFVRITDPAKPEVLAFMYSRTSPSNWRDVKVIQNTAYVVSEASRHGLQVFDLLSLRNRTDFQIVEADAEYELFGNAHNIVANEESKTIFVVGATDSSYEHVCRGGLHMIDVSDRLNPKFVACFGGDGYVHDAQCVMYHGPDTNYQGKEVCFCYNEDTLTIVDVTDKTQAAIISRVGYSSSMYTHQGWITEDHTVVLLDDELDEIIGQPRTRTYVWDVTNLADPVLKKTYSAAVTSIDHNQYIVGDLSFQSNYGAGLRILHLDQANYELTEVGYYDVYPSRTAVNFEGSWSNYPYYKSGNVAVSSIEFGLFVIKPDYEAIREDIRKRKQFAQQQRLRKVLFAAKGATCPALEQFRTCAHGTC